jgi:anti-sigma regulatory factor (Ser/Thr protein kinase)
VCGTLAEWDAWISYEAILNRAFAERPASVVCGYDARAVPGEVVAKAYEAHPYVLTDEHRECAIHREPEEIVRDLAPAPSPLPPMRPVPFADDREFKERLAFELAVARVPRHRARELLVAAVEILSNANYHANGARQLRVGHDDDRFVCEISDHGDGLDDPLAGFVPPRPGELDAAGLWVARQLTSRLEFVASHDGHAVRLWL